MNRSPDVMHMCFVVFFYCENDFQDEQVRASWLMLNSPIFYIYICVYAAIEQNEKETTILTKRPSGAHMCQRKFTIIR